jgi:hypothetical protein
MDCHASKEDQLWDLEHPKGLRKKDLADSGYPVKS